MSKLVNVEGSEIALKNSNGDIVIVPKKDRTKVEQFIKTECWGCVDNYVSGLPKMSNYAKDGSVITDGDPPKWQVPQSTQQYTVTDKARNLQDGGQEAVNKKAVKIIKSKKPMDGFDKRHEYLKQFTPEEKALIKSSNSSSELEPSFLQDFENTLLGFNTSGNSFKAAGTTEEEAVDAKGNPMNLIAPINIIPKLGQALYKKDYTIGQALSGKKNSASLLEDVVTDVTTYSPFIATKLLKSKALTNAIGKENFLDNLGNHYSYEDNVKPFSHNTTPKGLTDEQIELRNSIDDFYNNGGTEVDLNTFNENPYIFDNDLLPPPPHPEGTLYNEFGQPQLDDKGKIITRERLNSILDEVLGRKPGTTQNTIDLRRRQTVTQDAHETTPGYEQLFGVHSPVRDGSIRNKSGFSKDELLNHSAVKNKKTPSHFKDSISKMTEDEFKNTLLKPNGEVTTHIHDANVPYVNSDILSRDEYVKYFNDHLDELNTIINKNNKSGVKYEATELKPNGTLLFKTPAGQTTKNSRFKGKSIADIFNMDVREIFGGNTVPIRSGFSSFHTQINPGKWKGEVQDIANKDYYRSIPGLEMGNTGASVFADGMPRRGTGTYDSINEFLKKMDLGRVKPGFNSQTDYSRGLWENAINKDKAFGFYGNQKTVYGSMKSISPYAVPGAAMFLNKYSDKEIPQYQTGGITKQNKQSYVKQVLQSLVQTELK